MPALAILIVLGMIAAWFIFSDIYRSLGDTILYFFNNAMKEIKEKDDD